MDDKCLADELTHEDFQEIHQAAQGATTDSILEPSTIDVEHIRNLSTLHRTVLARLYAPPFLHRSSAKKKGGGV